jgi:hypothetical protein
MNETSFNEHLVDYLPEHNNNITYTSSEIEDALVLYINSGNFLNS